MGYRVSRVIMERANGTYIKEFCIVLYEFFAILSQHVAVVLIEFIAKVGSQLESLALPRWNCGVIGSWQQVHTVL